ncbi:hypothetical protein [Streptomyces sp. NPDC003077]|uniref:hypothetical protein n=1 Tax=Streptomyces sp. NPDC003077 TaxID=3154443 RepID=UPI0033A871D8
MAMESMAVPATMTSVAMTSATMPTAMTSATMPTAMTSATMPVGMMSVRRFCYGGGERRTSTAYSARLNAGCVAF